MLNVGDWCVDCILWFLPKLEDQVFEDFCAQIGVENIRQYEQGHLKHQSELDRKRYFHLLLKLQ